MSKTIYALNFKAFGWNVQIVPNMVRHGYRVWKARREGHYPGGYWDFQRCFYDPRGDEWLYGLSFGPLWVYKKADAAKHAHLAKASRHSRNYKYSSESTGTSLSARLDDLQPGESINVRSGTY